MRHAERSALVDGSAEAVFAFVSDIGNLPRWQSGVTRAEQTSPGPVGQGATARVDRRIAGQEVGADLVVRRFEPPRALELVTDAAGLHVEATVSVEPVDDGHSRVTFGMAMEATSIFMKPLEAMVAQAAESDIAASLAAVQRVFAPG